MSSVYASLALDLDGRGPTRGRRLRVPKLARKVMVILGATREVSLLDGVRR